MLCPEAVAHQSKIIEKVAHLDPELAEDVERVLSHAKTAADAKIVAAVERLAKSDRRLAATVEQWDNDPMLLCTSGGMADLRAGELRPARRDDYCTMMTAVAPEPRIEGGGRPPDLWLTFLDTVTRKNSA
jgi:putative DNA primase/helicase